MKTKALHIAPFCIQIFLLMFWLYVGVEKLWNLQGFHSALLRQPFPDSWADMLYWSLPLAEFGIGLLFICQQTKRSAYLFSALLLLIFSIYITLGLIGVYAERPCGCASVLNGLTWEWHLVVNMALFGLSILGWYLTGPTTPIGKREIRLKQSLVLFRAFMLLVAIPVYLVLLVFIRRFPRRFAVFPGRPVWKNLNYTFVARS
ncbi:MauE/DoxX family redox-associated membrane protein [Sphingobacterium gobiense]|uniref:Methylamine utilisation protein MauE domain-containing protein n=1 Tax=Sphingobacterium gobiense TaxID=1382456 RepID=A0A2S9JUT1_9SPHI|nr:MauE/DoxX family redox-associated membrane protein [Sphingobacterium gobiense]PRD57035.1 hypothetical protein C5749_07455 [Sphingobacterium gobiense]